MIPSFFDFVNKKFNVLKRFSFKQQKHYNNSPDSLFIAIPALCFLAVTIFRKVVNKKRPYEKLPIQSLIKKDKKGQSFPSRHVFSIFLIATLWFCFWKPVGIFLFIAGVFLAIVRVIGGVHFVTDVCAGALLGVLAGFLIC